MSHTQQEDKWSVVKYLKVITCFSLPVYLRGIPCFQKSPLMVLMLVSPIAQCMVVKCPPPAALLAKRGRTKKRTNILIKYKHVYINKPDLLWNILIKVYQIFGPTENENIIFTCLCSLERNTKVDCGVALRCSPRPIKVMWPFLEQAHAWLLATSSSAWSLTSSMMQGCRWTPSYCSSGAVRHSPVCRLLRVWTSGNQRHSCNGEFGLHSLSDTRPPSCTCRHCPRSLFRILKLDTSVKDRQGLYHSDQLDFQTKFWFCLLYNTSEFKLYSLMKIYIYYWI